MCFGLSYVVFLSSVYENLKSYEEKGEKKQKNLTMKTETQYKTKKKTARRWHCRKNRQVI